MYDRTDGLLAGSHLGEDGSHDIAREAGQKGLGPLCAALQGSHLPLLRHLGEVGIGDDAKLLFQVREDRLELLGPGDDLLDAADLRFQVVRIGNPSLEGVDHLLGRNGVDGGRIGHCKSFLQKEMNMGKTAFPYHRHKPRFTGLLRYMAK